MHLQQGERNTEMAIGNFLLTVHQFLPGFCIHRKALFVQSVSQTASFIISLEEINVTQTGNIYSKRRQNYKVLKKTQPQFATLRLHIESACQSVTHFIFR